MGELYSNLNTWQDFYKNICKCCIFANIYCLFCYTVSMDKHKAIRLAGSQSELARILGIHRTAVHQWKKIPMGRIYQLMVLRPDWFV
jgi:hypothetical protein